MKKVNECIEKKKKKKEDITFMPLTLDDSAWQTKKFSICGIDKKWAPMC